MIAFYTLIYHPHGETSLPGRCLNAYLRGVARGSAACLQWLGEPIEVVGATVLGRFPYVVVLDCAALDAQAMFAAGVIAFPASSSAKLLGLSAGVAAIWILNVGRLVLLYFAGARSFALFRWLHEEVFVVTVILAVCGLFFGWAWWARGTAPPRLVHQGAHAEEQS